MLHIEKPHHRMIEDYDRAFNTPEVNAIIEKTKVVLIQGRPIRYAKVTITTTDGAHVSSSGDGHEMPWVDWLPWLIERCDGLLDDDRLKRLVQLVTELEHLDDVSDLMACVRPSAKS